MTTYQIATDTGHATITGEAIGRYLATHKAADRDGWSIDHRPTGRRVAVAPTRAVARAVGRALAKAAGDDLATTDPDMATRVIVWCDAWAVIVALRATGTADPCNVAAAPGLDLYQEARRQHPRPSAATMAAAV